MRGGAVGALVAAALTLTSCSSGGDDPAAAGTNTPTEPSPTTDPAGGGATEVSTAPVPTATTATIDATETTEPPASLPPEPDGPSRCRPESLDADGEPIELRVWHGLGGDAVDFFDSLVRRFENEVPGVTVAAERVSTDYPGAIDELIVADPAAAPDLLLGSNTTVRLQADSGRFVPIGECTGGKPSDNFTDLLPVVERTYTVDGELLAAPFNVSTPVLIFDAMRWRRAGLDPSAPPETFDEWEVAIRQIVDTGEAVNGLVLYDRSASWLIEQAATKADEAIVLPVNGTDGASDDVVLATERAIDVLTTTRALLEQGYVRWIGINPSGNEDLPLLVNPVETAGMTLNSSAVLGDVSRLIDAGALPEVEIGVGPMPGPGPGATAGGGAWWLVDSGDERRIAASWLLAEWLTRPEIVAELAAFTGYIPSTDRAAAEQVVLDRWERDPGFKVGYEQLLATPDTPAGAGLQVGPRVEVGRLLELAAAFPIDGGTDPETELLDAEQGIAELLEIYESTRPNP